MKELIEKVKNKKTDRPRVCCEMGSYECQVPMPIKGRRQDIDLCIADIVAALNAANIITVASCCGHGTMSGNIMLEDGRTLLIKHTPSDPPPERNEANG